MRGKTPKEAEHAGPTIPGDEVYSFGPFRLLPAEQRLLRGDRPVRLGGRALEILVALVERAGHLVSKEELIARVWPNTCVEESNLKVHVAALRQALGTSPGETFIATTSGRGYRFVAPVERLATRRHPTRTPTESRTTHGLPVAAARMIGRESTMDALAKQLLEHRLISVVGPGGVGKTTVCIAMAERVQDRYRDGIWYVELAPVRDPQFVPSALISLLGLRADNADPMATLLAYLHDRELLIVLDSCEHLIGAAAAFAEQLLRKVRHARVLATSREPLRAPGERVHRLAPLGVPPVSDALTAADAHAHAAVELFVERAAAAVGDFKLEDAEAPAVAELCRRLEGLPLAIELAASRMDAFSPRELLGLMHDRLQLPLLKQSARGAVPRHQTLTAALDWSYTLLSGVEKTVLARLSVFAAPFSIESASAVAADPDSPAAAVIDALAGLVSKSLVCARSDAGTTQYRLLDTTRAYAFDKLDASGTLDAVLRRHAAHQRKVLERAEAQWQAHPTQGWLAQHARTIDDVRNALTWAFSPGGDIQEGIALTVCAIPLWTHLSLLDECRAAATRALSFKHEMFPRGERDEMKLHAALAGTMYGRGLSEDTEHSWLRALALAEKLADRDYQQRVLWGLTIFHIYTGNSRLALEAAQRLRTTTDSRTDPTMLLSVDRLTATALYLLGQQVSARALLERMLEQFTAAEQVSHITRFQLDQRAAALGTLAHVLWQLGRPGDAVRTCKQALEAALECRHARTIVNALVHDAFFTAFLSGDEPAAAIYIAMAKDQLRRHPLPLWSALVECIEGALRVQRRDPDGVAQMRASIAQVRKTGFGIRLPMYLGVLGSGLAALGRSEEGLEVLDEALALAEEREPCHFGSLLQRKGELLRSRACAAATQEAERYFLRALEWARATKVPGVELPAATSLATVWHERGELEQARDVLLGALNKVTQDLDTPDLRNARSLLEDLSRQAPHLHAITRRV